MCAQRRELGGVRLWAREGMWMVNKTCVRWLVWGLMLSRNEATGGPRCACLGQWLLAMDTACAAKGPHVPPDSPLGSIENVAAPPMPGAPDERCKRVGAGDEGLGRTQHC